MDIKYIQFGILTLVLTGILIGLGIAINDTMGNSLRTGTAVTGASGENRTMDVGLSKAFTNDHVDPSTVTFKNATSGASIPAAYFSITPSGKYKATNYVLLAAGQGYNHSDINVTYTYGADSTASDDVGNVSTGMADFVTWFTVIVIVIAAAVIIGLTMKGFGASR